jgi:hypothetical protein
VADHDQSRHGGRAASPLWSPDGSRLYFTQWPAAPAGVGLYSSRPNGGDLRRHTTGEPLEAHSFSTHEALVDPGYRVLDHRGVVRDFGRGCPVAGGERRGQGLRGRAVAAANAGARPGLWVLAEDGSVATVGSRVASWCSDAPM